MAAENARLEGLWGDALRLASDNGEVNMSWQKLGHIDEKVFQFTQTDGGLCYWAFGIASFPSRPSPPFVLATAPPPQAHRRPTVQTPD